MNERDNKQIVRSLVEVVFRDGDTSLLDRYVANDFVDHTPPPGLSGEGRAYVSEFTEMLKTAFPDYETRIEDEIAEGDKVVHRFTSSGTHRGPFLGIEPTGRRATWNEMHILRLRDGKVVEHWGLIDQLAMLQQLGVVEQRELAGARR